jgi:hypothetical protein
MIEGMNVAQLDAIERVLDIMREHFDAGVVVLTSDIEAPNSGEEKTATEIAWHGGKDRAIGLLKIGEFRILRKIENS